MSKSFTFENMGSRDNRGEPRYMFTIWNPGHRAAGCHSVGCDRLFGEIERLERLGYINRTRRRESWDPSRKDWTSIDAPELALPRGPALDSVQIFRETDRDFPD